MDQLSSSETLLAFDKYFFDEKKVTHMKIKSCKEIHTFCPATTNQFHEISSHFEDLDYGLHLMNRQKGNNVSSLIDQFATAYNFFMCISVQYLHLRYYVLDSSECLCYRYSFFCITICILLFLSKSYFVIFSLSGSIDQKAFGSIQCFLAPQDPHLKCILLSL